MIELIKGDKLYTDENLSVYNSGSYNPEDLVLVVKDGDELPIYQYQAIYIKTGECI